MSTVHRPPLKRSPPPRPLRCAGVLCRTQTKPQRVLPLQEWEFTAILVESGIFEGGIWFLVWWAGEPISEALWTPDINLNGTREDWLSTQHQWLVLKEGMTVGWSEEEERWIVEQNGSKWALVVLPFNPLAAVK